MRSEQTAQQGDPRPTRFDLIVRLLDTRDDNLPLPVVRTSHQPGFAHRVKVRLSCEDCLANGRVMKTCETCDGRGFLEVWRSRDPYAQSETVMPYGIDSAVKLGHVRERDAELGRLDQQLAAPWKSPEDELDDANRHPYAWEVARRQMYSRFDYRALDLALEQLAKACPSVSPRSPRGLSFIDARMPDPIRAPGEDRARLTAPALVRDGVRAARDERIRELAFRPDPPTAAEIAAEVRCSIRTVYRALTGEAA